jgi:hypothetical protein
MRERDRETETEGQGQRDRDRDRMRVRETQKKLHRVQRAGQTSTVPKRERERILSVQTHIPQRRTIDEGMYVNTYRMRRIESGCGRPASSACVFFRISSHSGSRVISGSPAAVGR